MKTYLAKPAEVVRKWYVVDASGKTLGRLAARVAILLRGKHKPTFTPHVDTGDHVVIINAEKIHLTGQKMKTKTYTHHTGYPGGFKSVTAEQLHEKNPTDLLNKAIKGTLCPPTLLLYLFTTPWPPNSFRSAATTFPVNVSLSNER